MIFFSEYPVLCTYIDDSCCEKTCYVGVTFCNGNGCHNYGYISKYLIKTRIETSIKVKPKNQLVEQENTDTCRLSEHLFKFIFWNLILGMLPLKYCSLLSQKSLLQKSEKYVNYIIQNL